MKKIVLLLCLILLLSACDRIEPPATEPATLPVETTPTTVPTEPPLIDFGIVTPLSGHSFQETPAVAILDSSTIAFIGSEFLTGKDAHAVTRVVVVDLSRDVVIAEETFHAALHSGNQTVYPGFLPLFDPVQDSCTLYDASLSPIGTFQTGNAGGVFTEDGASYIYIRAQQLCRLDMATGETVQIPTDISLPLSAITGYDPARGLLALDVFTHYYLDTVCPGLLDLNTGTFQVLMREGNACLFTGSGIGIRYSDTLHRGTNLLLTQPGATEGLQLLNFLAQDKDYATVHVSGSDYVLRNRYQPRVHKHIGTELLLLGEEILSCELDAHLNGLELRQLIQLPDGRLLGICREKKITQPVVIRPELLTFQPLLTPEKVAARLLDESVPADYAKAATPVAVAPELEEVRAMADTLEQRYGITILMSAQCQSIVEAMGYPLRPTDQAALRNEARELKDALAQLEEALDLYPEGFFLQFRNEIGQRGLLILLVENIGYSFADSNVDVLGVTYRMGDWYPIAVDITTSGLIQTYCHEIWHAIENKIESEDNTLFSSAVWNALNPKNFVYAGGVTEGYYNDKQYTYIHGACGTESYFVDPYGKTSPWEDRARLMEYVMASDFYGRHMMQAPVLYQKMELMINAIRAVFDTEGWQDVHWERYHN